MMRTQGCSARLRGERTLDPATGDSPRRHAVGRPVRGIAPVAFRAARPAEHAHRLAVVLLAAEVGEASGAGERDGRDAALRPRRGRAEPRCPGSVG